MIYVLQFTGICYLPHANVLCYKLKILCVRDFEYWLLTTEYRHTLEFALDCVSIRTLNKILLFW